jgi:hypothetical protein
MIRSVAGMLVAGVVALILIGGAAPAPPPQPTSIVVRGDVQIGGFLVQRNGTLDGAIRAFGKPTSLRRGRYGGCIARWRPIGLRIGFYNLGGRDPCLRQYGHFSNAVMVGRHWVTPRGLRPAIRREGSTCCIHRVASPARGPGSLAATTRRTIPTSGFGGKDPSWMGDGVPRPVPSGRRLAQPEQS